MWFNVMLVTVNTREVNIPDNHSQLRGWPHPTHSSQ